MIKYLARKISEEMNGFNAKDIKRLQEQLAAERFTNKEYTRKILRLEEENQLLHREVEMLSKGAGYD